MTTEEIRAYMRTVPNEGDRLHSCPSLADLSDYLRDACAPEYREAIQTHLIACVECSENLLELAGISSAAEQVSVAVPPALDQEWRRLRSRLRPEQERKRIRFGVWLSPFRQAFSAACAVVASLALTWGLFLQQRVSVLVKENSSLLRQQTEITQSALRAQSEVAILRGPQVNLPVFDALPAGVAERSSAAREANVFTLPPSGRFAMVLSGAAQHRNGDYRIQIRNGREQEVFSSPGLRPDAQGNFLITFDREFLLPGLYTVDIGEQTTTGITPLARYAIRLVDQRGSPYTAAAAQ